jgi:predicted aspartyl protease
VGYVFVTVALGDPLKQRVRDVRMLVDTGATYPCIPKWPELMGVLLQ